MAHSIMMYLFVALTFSFNLVKCSADALESNVKVTVIKNFTKFLNENFEIETLHPLVREQLTDDDPSPMFQLTYYAGRRVNGDQLVGKASDSYSWNSVDDRRLTLTYPKTGEGAIITYVYIVVEQSTQDGAAKITKGGLGYRYIEFYVDAYQTYYLKYSLEIYGFY